MTGCDKYDSKLQIYNNSNSTLCYFINDSLNFESQFKNSQYHSCLKPKELKRIITTYESWEYTINHVYEEKKIFVFFYGISLISKFNQNDVEKSDFLDIISYSVDDLVKMNWKIVYDGN
jgi:hypothetical protein